VNQKDSAVSNYKVLLVYIYLPINEYLQYVLMLGDVTLSVYPHRAGLENMPGHGVDIHSE
jgi:hypothetical protein